jgi:hypothetical protein
MNAPECHMQSSSVATVHTEHRYNLPQMHLDSVLHCMAGLEATMCIFFYRLTVDDLAVLLLYHALPS